MSLADWCWKKNGFFAFDCPLASNAIHTKTDNEEKKHENKDRDRRSNQRQKKTEWTKEIKLQREKAQEMMRSKWNIKTEELESQNA